MRKKYLSALLFGALLFASAGTFTSCKDYDDDINNLSQRVDQIASDLADLETKVNALGCVESIEFSDGKLIVHTPNGDVSAAMPECTGIKEVKLEGNTLYVDGVEAGKVELGSGEEGQIPVITVKDGKLYVNDQLMDIEVGSNVVLVDNGDTCTITVDGQSVTLMKNAAQLTSIQFEDETEFKSINGRGDIKWALATKATPNWAGEKGAVALNQLLIGQISTVNVQVTPADYDLGAQKLTLVDSKGNEAPVIITAKPNNLLMKGRAASANGSWILSATIDQTKVNEGNIATAFDWDMTSRDAMAYTLCVNGKPFTTYDFTVIPADNKQSFGKILASATDLYFVDAEGREYNVQQQDIPAGETTELVYKNQYLYDYYYTFEGTYVSKANQYGIKISEDGKSIEVPAEAAGVEIGITVHTMSITGDVYPNAGDSPLANTIILNIAGSEIEAQTVATTTHQVKPGDALEEIRVDFKTAEGKNVFENFSAANLEAARNLWSQFKVIEENTQTNFLVESWPNSDNEQEIRNVTYYKADDTLWDGSFDDMLDLSYMKLTVAGNVASDARPGNYNLTFVVEDENNVTGVSGNELIKVTIPVAITVPTFDELFTKDANWNEAKDTYTSRIIISGTDAMLGYTNAFGKTGDFDVETSHINLTFNALDEYNKYPIDTTVPGVEEYVTDNTRAVTTPISSDIKLDKANVYNDDMNALEVNKLTNMYAYYDTFDGETGISNDARQAFTIVSKPFATEIKTALDGVKAAFYKDNAEVANVTLNTDNTITQGTGDGSDGAKFNGLIFTLNNDYLHVNQNNLDGGTTYDLLDIFNLYEASFLPAGWLTGNIVKVEFEGGNNEVVDWDNNQLRFNITKDASTLKITFTDATGIEYKQEIKVQRAR